MTYCIYYCVFLHLSYSELVLDNIELLFIHKNRPRLQTEAVLLNTTQEEVLGTNTILEREVSNNIVQFISLLF